MGVRPGCKQTELGVIPEEWAVSTISKSMRLINGCAFKPHEWRKQGIPIIRIQNLNDSAADFNYFQGQIDERNRVVAGDVLFAWSGTLGSSFGARIWNGSDGVLNQHIFKVIADERVFTKHYSYLIFKRVQEAIEKKSHGFKSSFVHVKKSDIDDILLPIPPLAEQRAIATALSDVDALLAKLDQLITKKRDLKQAAMQQLLTGKKRLPGFQNDCGYKQTEIGTIPSDWEVKSVREFTRSHKQGYYTKDRYIERGVRLVRITDLLNPLIDFPAMPMLDVSSKNVELYKIKVGDFLFARSGAIGRYGVVYENVEAIFGSYIIRFTFNSGMVSNEFFGLLYETEIVWEQLFSITQGSSNININANNIKSIKIPLPSFKEQTAIATILSDMDAEITALEARRDKTRALKQGMMQELLTGRIRLV